MKDTLRKGTMIVGAALLFAGAGCSPDHQGGEVCTKDGDSTCNSENTQLYCEDGKWKSNSKVDDYTCDCINRDWDGCAIPGFVGIAEAGRARAKGRRLRQRRPRLTLAAPSSDQTARLA